MTNRSRSLPRITNYPRHWTYALFALYVLVVGLFPSLAAVGLRIEAAGLLVATHLLAITGIAVVLGLKSPRGAVLILTLILPWQPVLSMPWADELGANGVRMLVATKDVYVTVLLPALYFRNRHRVRWDTSDLAAGLFMAVYLVFAALSPASLFGIAVSLREGWMIAALYLVGRLSLLTLNDVRWFLITVIFLALAVAIFGYGERFLFSEDVWTALGAGDYVEAKQGQLIQRYDTPGEVPKNWYTHIDRKLYRRMVAGIGDPTSLSRFLALPVLAILWLPGLFHRSTGHRMLRFFMMALLSGALLLTFGRGGLLIILGGVVLWSLTTKRSLALIVAPLTLLLFFTAPVFDLESGSAPGHIDSAVAGYRELMQSPIGRGLGTAGQKALFYSNRAVAGTGESYLAALAFQTGILGVVAYTLFVMTLAYRLFRIYWHIRRIVPLGDVRHMPTLGLALVLGVFVTSLFANSAVAPISAGLSLVYCGALITVFSQRRKSPSSAATLTRLHGT